MFGTVFWESGFNFKEIGVATMVLFAVIDIVGTIPMIIALKEKTGKIYPLRTSLVALFILIGFLFLGESILGVIGVGINEFAVAGSFVLFLVNGLRIAFFAVFNSIYPEHWDLAHDTSSYIFFYPVVLTFWYICTQMSSEDSPLDQLQT